MTSGRIEKGEFVVEPIRLDGNGGVPVVDYRVAAPITCRVQVVARLFVPLV